MTLRSAPRQPVVLYQPRDGGAAMPLGLLALGSWLEGRHVVIVDGRFELAPEARVVELAKHALLFFVSARTGEPLREALRVSRAARAASPTLPILWGGPHAAVDPESCFATGVVDGCVAGAGEESLEAAVEAARSERPLATAAGVMVPGGEAIAPARPPTHLWPRADYSLLDTERYFEERGVRRLDYCSSRGVREDPDWLGLRAERVVAETVELAERYRATELTFKDEDFFADEQRVLEIADGLVETGAAVRVAGGGPASGRARGEAGRAGAPLRERVPRPAGGVQRHGPRRTPRSGDPPAGGGHRREIRVRRERGRGDGRWARRHRGGRARDLRDGQPLRDAVPPSP